MAYEDAIETGKDEAMQMLLCISALSCEISFKYYEIILDNPNLRRKVKPVTLCILISLCRESSSKDFILEFSSPPSQSLCLIFNIFYLKSNEVLDI